MNGNFSHCSICDGPHDAEECPRAEMLRAVACSSFCHPAERCSLTGSGICDALGDASADGLICWLEQRGYGWSLDHTGQLIEARIWDWPNVIGRYRPKTIEPLADMLRGAMRTMTREQLCKTNAEVRHGAKDAYTD